MADPITATVALLSQAAGAVGAGATSVASWAAPSVMTNGAVDLWKVGGEIGLNALKNKPSGEVDVPSVYNTSVGNASQNVSQKPSGLMDDPILAAMLSGGDYETLSQALANMNKQNSVIGGLR